MLLYHSDYTISSSAAPISKVVKRAKALGFNYAAITDTRTVSGSIKFLDTCLKENIKPIIGMQGNYCTLYAKNKTGYHNLCLTANSGKVHKEGLMGLSGYLHSDLYKLAFKEHRLDEVSTYQDTEALLVENAENLLEKKILQYQRLFAGDFYIGLQRIYEDCLPTINLFNKIAAKLAKKHSVPILSVPDVWYVNEDEAPLHKILLANKYKCELLNVEAKLSPEELQFNLCNRSYIIQLEDFSSKTELCSLEAFIAKIEDYNLRSFPQMTPYCENDEKLFDELLEAGKSKVENWDEVYETRLKEEVELMKSFSILVTYFLVVWDYCKWAKEQGMRIGERGSAAGCLITYLLGITNLDPLKYGLLFSRFFNEGRIKKDGVALPDIDVDFPALLRDSVQEYIVNKHEKDRVAYMRTFGRFKGREALKTIFRVYNSVNHTESNKIAKLIFQNDKISGELEEMSKTRGHASAIIYSLENVPALHEYCTVEYDEETGEYTYDGDRAFDFKKAVQLEGLIKQKGRHAAGLAICHENLARYCEIEQDKDRHVANMEMNELESLGIPKLDILSSLSLDKIMYAEKLINGQLG